MINKLFGDDTYYVVVNATIPVNSVKHRIVTTFNKKQAKVGQDILNNTHQERVQFGTKILNGLDQMRATKQLKPDTNFTATLKDKSTGLVQTIPVSLHWRAMRLLALACICGNEFYVAQLSGVLRNIEAGSYEPKETVTPFLGLEGK